MQTYELNSTRRGKEGERGRERERQTEQGLNQWTVKIEGWGQQTVLVVSLFLLVGNGRVIDACKE